MTCCYRGLQPEILDQALVFSLPSVLASLIPYRAYAGHFATMGCDTFSGKTKF